MIKLLLQPQQVIKTEIVFDHKKIPFALQLVFSSFKHMLVTITTMPSTIHLAFYNYKRLLNMQNTSCQQKIPCIVINQFIIAIHASKLIHIKVEAAEVKKPTGMCLFYALEFLRLLFESTKNKTTVF